MKLSIPDWTAYDDALSAEENYRQLARAGYQAAEMVAPERRVAARDAGLKLINFAAPGISEGPADASLHADLAPLVRAAIAEASDEGIPQLIVFSGNGDDYEQGLANCAEFYGPLAELAEERGVVLVFEMLSSLDHPGYLGASGRFGFELCRAIGSPYFKTVYDAYHLVRMGDDVVRDLAENIDLVAHIHLAEPPNRTPPVFDGVLPLRDLIRVAEAGGYDGFWGVEYIPRGPRLPLAAETAARLLS